MSMHDDDEERETRLINLERNKMSAKRSRQKKKAEKEGLIHELFQVRQENEKLKTENELLKTRLFIKETHGEAAMEVEGGVHSVLSHFGLSPYIV